MGKRTIESFLNGLTFGIIVGASERIYPNPLSKATIIGMPLVEIYPRRKNVKEIDFSGLVGFTAGISLAYVDKFAQYLIGQQL